MSSKRRQMFNPKFRNSKKAMQALGNRIKNTNNKSNSEVIEEMKQENSQTNTTTPVELKEEKAEAPLDTNFTPDIVEDMIKETQQLASKVTTLQEKQEQKDTEGVTMKIQGEPIETITKTAKKPVSATVKKAITPKKTVTKKTPTTRKKATTPKKPRTIKPRTKKAKTTK